MLTILIVLTVAFALLRFVVPVTGKINRGDIFKDLAHILVGLLLGYGFADPAGWYLGVALTAVEIVAFIVRKKP